jgi:hypothetical protein
MCGRVCVGCLGWVWRGSEGNARASEPAIRSAHVHSVGARCRPRWRPVNHSEGFFVVAPDTFPECVSIHPPLRASLRAFVGVGVRVGALCSGRDCTLLCTLAPTVVPPTVVMWVRGGDRCKRRNHTGMKSVCLSLLLCTHCTHDVPRLHGWGSVAEGLIAAHAWPCLWQWCCGKTDKIRL